MSDAQLKKIMLTQNINSGADWFYWISALSLINSVVTLSGNSWGFLIGLTICQTIDSAAMKIASTEANAIILAIIVDFLCVSFVASMGYLVRKKNWLFIPGIILYTLDTVLTLYVQDWPGAAFHAFAIFSIIRAYLDSKKLRVLESIERAINKPEIT